MSPRKVAQNELKHILVLEFLRSDDFWGGGGVSLCEIQTDTCHSDQISHSARRDGVTKNQNSHVEGGLTEFDAEVKFAKNQNSHVGGGGGEELMEFDAESKFA